MARTDEHGVPVMGDELRSGPVHGDGGPVFGMQVWSETTGSGVSVRGELDVATAPHLQQVLDRLCRDGGPDIVLDLSGLTFLSAAGLTVLHHVDGHLRATGGRLILHRPGWLTRRVLAITNLETVLTIRPTTAHTHSGDHQSGRGAVLTDGAAP